MVNGVKMFLPAVTPAQAALTPRNARGVYEPTRLLWQVPRVLHLLAVCGRFVSSLFKESVSHLGTEAVYSIFVSSGRLNALLVIIKQVTDVGCWRCPNGWQCQDAVY